MELKISTFVKETGNLLYMQIYEKLKKDIEQGYLKKGEKLPSIRKSEAIFKVSKTSVEKAYGKLVDEGYVIAKPQSGYFVDMDEEQIKKRSFLFKQEEIVKEKIRFDFRSESMDEHMFDTKLWKKYIKEVLENHSEIATYGNAQGELMLRKALQQYAYSVRGVLCSADDIIVGSSFQSLLYLLCGLLPHDLHIGMEEECYIQAKKVFQDYHYEISNLTLFDDGVSIQELNDKNIDLLYINAGSQGKLHQPLSKKKRAELIQWAKETNSYIIEDDHNGELRYISKVNNSMQGFDIGEHIFYIGSFSRLLLPSLRISYLVLTKKMSNVYKNNKFYYAPTSSKIEQLALAHYIMDGHLERHVKRLTKKYEKKCKNTEMLIQKYFPDTAYILEEASLQFILTFENIDIECLKKYLDKEQIACTFTKDKKIMLSFAAIEENEMEEGIHLLSSIIKKSIA